MAELESYYYYEDRVITPATHLYRVYHADEADKVIAELNRSDRHQKHERCLAMAKWCFTKSNYHFILYRHGENVKENKRKLDLYSKWHKRWLDIAEKFKESDK